MNYKMVFYTIGYILIIMSALLLLPLIISFICADGVWLSYIWTMLMCLLPGVGLAFIKPKTKSISAREGIIIVGLSWVIMTLLGAFPFFLSNAIPNFAEALFESASGFSTTGSTILKVIEVLPKSVLFYRSYIQWIGGIGILLFVLTILPNAAASTLHLMRAESTGPQVGKIVSKMKITARILYVIYFVLTVVQTILLLCGGLGIFDSVVISFSTISTGGLSVKNLSIETYQSVYVTIITGLFMFLSSINFAVFYLIIIGQFRKAFKDEELRWFVAIFVLAVLIIAIDIKGMYATFGDALLQSFFQVASIFSCCGFSTTNFAVWPVFSQTLLMVLMFIGGCAGSTAGGFKTIRFATLTKATFRKSRNYISPRDVSVVKINGKMVENDTLSSIWMFFVAYVAILVFGALLLALVDGFDMVTNFTSVLACMSNAGPGLSLVGPYGNFSIFSNFSKTFLSFIMLVGRLEIFPILMLFSSKTWRIRSFR